VSVRSHPADAILAAYAGGGLRAGFDLVVAAHLEACPVCRRAVRLFETAAAGLVDATQPAAMEADALSHLMARLDREPQAPEPAVAPDPRPLIERLPLKRRRWLAPGTWVQQVDVPHAPEDRIYLLRMRAGLKGIDHSHSGTEFTQVISGALNDNGEILRAGDFWERDTDDRHQAIIEPDDGGCVCLAATVGPLVGRSWLGRLIGRAAGV
jgi:putative transcriptional regulator